MQADVRVVEIRVRHKKRYQTLYNVLWRFWRFLGGLDRRQRQKTTKNCKKLYMTALPKFGRVVAVRRLFFGVICRYMTLYNVGWPIVRGADLFAALGGRGMCRHITPYNVI